MVSLKGGVEHLGASDDKTDNKKADDSKEINKITLKVILLR
jgi:hypothetical protein